MICGFKMCMLNICAFKSLKCIASFIRSKSSYHDYTKNRWHRLLLTNTAPFSMSGTTIGMKPCRSQKESLAPVHVNITIIVWTLYLIFPDTCLPVAVVCQGQSFGVQSEVWPLLPSDSRICGLRHELDVCRRGQRNKVQQPFISIRWNKYQTKHQTSR